MSDLRHDHGATDSLAVAEFLRGTWRFSAEGDARGTGWLHFTGDGFAVQFSVFPAESTHRIPQRFWYEIEAADTLRFRTSPDHEGWTRSCLRQDESSFVLGAGDIVFPCTRLSANDYPEWFAESLAYQLTQFPSR